MTIAEKLLRAKTDYDEVYDAGYNEGVAAQPVPTITVGADGLITSSAGEKSATKQLPTQAAKTITPGYSPLQAVAAGKYTTGNVSVKGDTNFIASNIKKGVKIFGVTGTCDDYDEGRKAEIPWDVQLSAPFKQMSKDNYGSLAAYACEPSVFRGSKLYTISDLAFKYDLSDWLEIYTEGDESTPYIVTIRNKHRRFKFEVYLHIICYDPDGYEAQSGNFYLNKTIPALSSLSFDFDCQGWNDGGWWEYEIEGVRVYA